MNKIDAMNACREAGERLGEMAREMDFYEAGPRNDDAEYLLPRIEKVLSYTDALGVEIEALAAENDDLEYANMILSSTVDTLAETLLDVLERR